MIDPAIGIDVAIYAGAAGGLTVTIILLIWGINVDALLSSLLDLLFGVAVALSIFCIVFAVINPILQFDQISVAAIRNDLSNGTSMLRVTSVILGLKILWLVGHFLVVENWVLSNRYLYKIDDFFKPFFAYHKSESEFAGLSDEKLSSCDERDILTAAQYGLFLVVLTLLWTYSALGISSALTLYLNLTLFFFVDDWVIISGYFNILRGRMLQSHRRRILIANIMLAPFAAVSSLIYLHHVIAVAYCIATLLILFWIYYDFIEELFL